MAHYSQPSPSQPSASSSFSSFVLLGCGGLLIVFVLLLVFSYRTLSSFRSELLKYTSTTAQMLPQAPLSDGDWKALQTRVDRFSSALSSFEVEQTLRLSSHEINAILQRHPAFLPIRDRLHITLEKGAIKGKISLPLSSLPGFKNRYLNAKVSFALQTKAAIRLSLASIATEEIVENKTVEKPLPEHLVAGLSQIDLMAALYENPKTKTYLQAIAKVEIKDSFLLLTSGPPPSKRLHASSPAKTDLQKTSLPPSTPPAPPAVTPPAPASRPLLPTSAPAPR